MIIEPFWKRIAGIHCVDDGSLAAVWLVHNPDTDKVTCYDTSTFSREVLAVIVEGLAARGRWIPIAWDKSSKEMADKLRDRGLNMLPEPSSSGEAMAEVISREIWERMRSDRFKVDKRLGAWIDEMKSFSRKDAKVPVSTHPLMTATRNAMEMLTYARRQAPKNKHKRNYQEVAII